jgi:hypothetical protein
VRKRRISSDDDRRPIIAGFNREDLDRLNRLAHAKNLRGIIKCTKWLNDHGVELLRGYPQEFRQATGMTVGQYLHALNVHVDCCRTFINKAGGLEALTRSAATVDGGNPSAPRPASVGPAPN